jgi:hypothetical protein
LSSFSAESSFSSSSSQNDDTNSAQNLFSMAHNPISVKDTQLMSAAAIALLAFLRLFRRFTQDLWMNRLSRTRSTGDVHQRLLEVGVNEARPFREGAEGFSTTGVAP